MAVIGWEFASQHCGTCRNYAQLGVHHVEAHNAKQQTAASTAGKCSCVQCCRVGGMEVTNVLRWAEVLGLERAQARAVQTRQGNFCIITISTLKLTLTGKMSMSQMSWGEQRCWGWRGLKISKFSRMNISLTFPFFLSDSSHISYLRPELSRLNAGSSSQSDNPQWLAKPAS